MSSGRWNSLSSDEERRERARCTGGNPVVDFRDEPPPYITYTMVDELLRLQNPRTDCPAELTFLIVGQVQELLFKLAYEDLCRSRALLDCDDVAEAVRRLRHVRAVADLLTPSWDLVGAMSPVEFLRFRDHLGLATGFQSFMYRMVEFLLGNKNFEMARPFAGAGAVYQQVLEAFLAPSVEDAALALLARWGVSAPVAKAGRTVRPDPDIERAWAEVYAWEGPGGPVHDLAETLMSVAEGFSRWRAVHLLVVEKTIGTKPGTGGTDGVSWLRRINEHRFFPELWSARRLLDVDYLVTDGQAAGRDRTTHARSCNDH